MHTLNFCCKKAAQGKYWSSNTAYATIVATDRKKIMLLIMTPTSVNYHYLLVSVKQGCHAWRLDSASGRRLSAYLVIN